MPAADAIADFIAPPPARAQTPAARDDGPSFAEHLDAHEDARDEVSADKPARAERPDNAPAANDEDDARCDSGAPDEPPNAAAPALNTQPPQQPSPPAMIQILASLAGAADAEASAASAPGDEQAAPETVEEAPPQQSAGAASDAQVQAHAHHGKHMTHAKAVAPAKGAAATAAAAPQAEAAPAELTDSSAETAAQSAEALAPAPVSDAPPAPAVNPDAAALAAAPPPVKAASGEAKDARVDDLGVKADAAAKQPAPPPEAKEELRGKAGREVKAEADAPAPTAPPRTNFAALLAKQDGLSAPAAAPAAHAGPLAASAAATTQAAAQTEAAARAAPASAQVGHAIVRRFNGENTRFELRLDPPELGRVEVKLEVSRDHRVTAVVSAESPHALAELTRHARELQDTLQSAGLDLADDGLSFDLANSGQNFAEPDADARGRGNGQASERAGLDTNDAPQTPRPVRLEPWRGARVDLVA